MNLVRDLLDKAVSDRNGRPMGRVDGVVLEQREGAAPRVLALEIGPSVLAFRLHPTAGRWMAALEHACGVDAGRPVRIPFGDVIDIGRHIKVDAAIGESGAGNVEQRLRAWISKLPGAG